MLIQQAGKVEPLNQSLGSVSPNKEFLNSRLIPEYPKIKSPLAISKHALIVTHAHSDYDKKQTAKQGIDETIALFKKNKLPVIYLSGNNDLPPVTREDWVEGKRWYTEDRHPDYLLFSDIGEHQIDVRVSEVTLVGGAWDRCLSNAIYNLLLPLLRRGFISPFTIHFPMDAIYVSSTQSFEKYLQKHGDSFLNQFLFGYFVSNPNQKADILIHGEFTFNFFIDDHLVMDGMYPKTVGFGNRHMWLKFWSSKHHPLFSSLH